MSSTAVLPCSTKLASAAALAHPERRGQVADGQPLQAVHGGQRGGLAQDRAAGAFPVGAAESGRPTLMFQTKEAVRLALDGVATGVACDGCPPLPDLLARYDKAGGRYMVCPICFNAKQLDKGSLLANAELAGTVQLWEWIGDQGATTFSY
jgi:predicted peroxiredoxin